MYNSLTLLSWCKKECTQHIFGAVPCKWFIEQTQQHKELSYKYHLVHFQYLGYTQLCMQSANIKCTYSVHCGHPRWNALTNANRQCLQVVPWNSHSALVLSTLALLVASEGECCSPTTTSSLIHLLPVVPRHQLALWVVPLYRSGHWSCVLLTVHSLISRPDGQRYNRVHARQANAAILQESSRHWRERSWQEKQIRQRTGVKLMYLERVQECYPTNLSAEPRLMTEHHAPITRPRSIAQDKCSGLLSDIF